MQNFEAVFTFGDYFQCSPPISWTHALSQVDWLLLTGDEDEEDAGSTSPAEVLMRGLVLFLVVFCTVSLNESSGGSDGCKIKLSVG